jgi:CO/xanthine dehydrogenase Mo-binding subunit
VARRVGRPVKWAGERSESFLSDYQGRDLTVEAELALDNHGKFLAVRGSNLSNLGAYSAVFVSLQKGIALLSGVYHIPTGYVRGRGVVTNIVPTTPYRSAGRPEIIFVIERLIDLAVAREDLPDDVQGPLTGISDETLPVASFPYGTHVCEVEIDPDSGLVEIVGYTVVDDVGRAINPMIVHGQTHGGIAQGVGQALLEDIY